MDEPLILRQADSLREAISLLAGSTATDAAGKVAAFTEQLRRLQALPTSIGARPAGPAASTLQNSYGLAGLATSMVLPMASLFAGPSKGGPAGLTGQQGIQPGKAQASAKPEPVPVEVVKLPEGGSLAGAAGAAGSTPAPADGPPTTDRTAGKATEQRTIAEVYAEQQKRIEGLAKQERERAKYLASPAGLAMLQQQAKAARELAAAQREARYAGVAAEQGAMAAGLARLNDQTAGLRQSYASLMSTAQSTYQAGASAMMSLVSAADPFSTWPTFQASIEGLSISIGQTLLPYIDMASGAVQRLTRLFDGLSDTNKSWVGMAIAGSTALAGIVLVGGKVVSTVMAIGSAMRAAAVAGMAMNATMGPIGWMTLAGGIGTATAGLITYAGAWGTVADRAKEAGGAIAGALGAAPSLTDAMTGPEQIKAKRREAQAITVEEMGRLPWNVRKQMMDPKQTAEGRAKVIEDYAVVAKANMEKAQREATELPAAQAARDEIETRLVRERLEESRQEFLRYARSRTPDGTPREVLEERSARTSARRLMVDLAARGEAPKDLEGQQEMTQSLATRIALALGGKDYSQLRQQTSNAAAESAAAEAKAQMDLAERLRQKAGVAATAKQAEADLNSPDEIKRSQRGMPRAQISDSQGYADRLAVAALSESELDNDNLQKRLESLERKQELLVGKTNEILTEISGRLSFPKSWR